MSAIGRIIIIVAGLLTAAPALARAPVKSARRSIAKARLSRLPGYRRRPW